MKCEMVQHKGIHILLLPGYKDHYYLISDFTQSDAMIATAVESTKFIFVAWGCSRNKQMDKRIGTHNQMVLIWFPWKVKFWSICWCRDWRYCFICTPKKNGWFHFKQYGSQSVYGYQNHDQFNKHTQVKRLFLHCYLVYIPTNFQS